MSLRSVRSKLFLGMGTVILLFIALSLLIVSQLVKSFGREEIARNLDAARVSFDGYERMRRRLLQDKGRSLADAPYLKATMSIEELDHETAHYSAQRLDVVAQTDLLLLLDHRGRLLANSADPTRFGNDLSRFPSMDEALRGRESNGVWEYRNNIYLVTISPILTGDSIVGALVLGELVEANLANQIRQATGRDVLVFHAGTLAAEAWRPSQSYRMRKQDAESLAQELTDVRRADQDSIVSFQVGGTPCLGTAVVLDHLTIVLSRPLHDFESLYLKTSKWLLVVGVSMGCLALLVSQVISLKIARPIRELVNASEVMAQGDLSAAVPERGNDELTRLSCSFNNMARRVESLVNEINEKAKQAEAANTAKSKFLSNISHELRTPLNGIIGFTQLLSQGVGDADERRDWIATINGSGRHLLELVNEILDIAKIEKDSLEVERVPCSPAAIVSDVASMLRGQAVQKDLTLDVSYEGEIPALINTDPKRLRQLLMNLTGNAIKFTSAGGVRLFVRLVQYGEMNRLRIEVVDTGIGVAAGRLDSIFDPFVQADDTITRDFGGTGLGLTISKRIAEALDGSLAVKSEVGKGSVFTCEVGTGSLAGVETVSEMTLEGLNTTPARLKPRPTLSHRILVVDDGNTNRKLICFVLQQAGASVEQAENGQEAVDLAASGSFDLILMDMQMPVMDGYTATRILRERGIDCPIVAITAQAMKGDREKCKTAGCSDYISKPVDTDLLLEIMAATLNPKGAQSGPVNSRPSETENFGGSLVSHLSTDNPVIAEIVEEFVELARERTSEMEQALAVQDMEELARLAHWLKGSGGTAGFDAFTKPAARLEALAKGEELDQVLGAVEELKQIVNRIEVGPAALV